LVEQAQAVVDTGADEYEDSFLTPSFVPQLATGAYEAVTSLLSHISTLYEHFLVQINLDLGGGREESMYELDFTDSPFVVATENKTMVRLYGNAISDCRKLATSKHKRKLDQFDDSASPYGKVSGFSGDDDNATTFTALDEIDELGESWYRQEFHVKPPAK
jgi:hypothetical protein